MFNPIITITFSIIVIVNYYFFNNIREIESSRNNFSHFSKGKPLNLIEKLSGSKWFPGNFPRLRSLYFQWLFITPEWAKGNKTTMNYFWKFRISSLIWLIILLIWFFQ